MENWTKKEIHNWLMKKGIDSINKKSNNINGITHIKAVIYCYYYVLFCCNKKNNKPSKKFWFVKTYYYYTKALSLKEVLNWFENSIHSKIIKSKN